MTALVEASASVTVPETLVHAHKMTPGHIGIEHIDCNKKYGKYVQFITCRTCDTPLRIQVQAKKNEYTNKAIDQWWHTIEPMVHVNPCWWFCTDCYPVYPDKTPLLPTENSLGFRESSLNLILVNKSKPYGVEYK